MHPLFLNARDVVETCDVGKTTASKMIKHTNEEIVKSGYTVIRSGSTSVKRFCEIYGIEYEKFLENLVEARSKRQRKSNINSKNGGV